MKKIFALMIALVLVFSCASAMAELQFTTGGQSGTYFGFGNVLAQYITNNTDVAVKKIRLQLEAVYGTLEDLEKKDPNRNYGVRVKERNGLIFAKTCEDYDRLIGDISQSAVSEMASEIFDRIWKDRPDEVRVPFDGRFVNKAEFIEQIRRLGGFE